MPLTPHRQARNAGDGDRAGPKNATNDDVGVDWHFTTADARMKLKRLYPSFGS
jgi:hypothetical protein